MQSVKRLNDSFLQGKAHFEDLDFKSLPQKLLLDSETQQLLEMNLGGKLGIVGLVDFLRLRLVAEYGGNWLDSTVLVEPNGFVNLLRLRDYYLNAQSNQDTFYDTKPTLVTWAFGANDSRHFLRLWATVLASTWIRNGGSYTYFDSYIVASHLLSLGAGPENRMKTDEQQRLLANSGVLMSGLLEGAETSTLVRLHQSSPLHKLSHKVSKSEEIRIADSLNRLQRCN